MLKSIIDDVKKFDESFSGFHSLCNYFLRSSALSILKDDGEKLQAKLKMISKNVYQISYNSKTEYFI